MSKDKGDHKYLTYCIPAGLLVGTVISVLFSLNIGMGAGMEMLLGIVIGTMMDWDSKKAK